MPAVQGQAGVQTVPVPLVGGFYQSRSIIANDIRCVNLYPEKNDEGAPTKFTDYLTPGLTLLRAVGDAFGPVSGQARPGGAYLASNGGLYICIGPTLYFVDPTWRFFTLGNLTTSTGLVCMQDNGNDLVIVDGTISGFSVNLVSNVMIPYPDANFLGADRVDYLDTFLIFNQPNTRNFYCTLSNVLTIDPTYVASKTSYPDNIQTLIVNHRELWLLGSQKSSELWYDAGGTQFPFQIEPGVYIEQGCVAKASVARHDVEVYWLGINADGKATVFLGKDYKANPISTFAIADEISKYPVISDAIGMIYQQLDHVFYVLVFPSASRTWVFDRSQGLWHERMWLDADGLEQRIRPNFLCAAYGKILAGDWETGDLYHYDMLANTDNGQPITRIRSFPHLQNAGKRSSFSRFVADMECGTVLDSSDYTITLRYSYDKGKTWKMPVTQSLGNTGEYLVWPTWAGSQGITRDMLYELSWSSPVGTALNGAYCNVVPAGT